MDDLKIQIPKSPMIRTISLNKKLNELELKKEKLKIDNELKCCSGSNIDRRIIKFAIQISSSVVMISLCVYKLIDGVKDDERTLYISMLTSIVSYWFESPRIN